LIVDRLAVAAQLAFVAIHDDVEHLLQRKAVLQRLGATIDDDVTEEVGDGYFDINIGLAVFDFLNDLINLVVLNFLSLLAGSSSKVGALLMGSLYISFIA
jgi:hypothetical protein